MKRLLIWVGVLLVSAGVGFGYGAATFHPPDPQLEGVTTAAPATSPASVPSSIAANLRVVPSLVGMTRKAAEAELKHLGPLFIVQPLGGSSDRVVTQNPAAGSKLKDVSRIAIGVHCKSKPCPAPAEGRVIYDPCSCATR